MFYILAQMTLTPLPDFELAVLLSLASLYEPYGASIRREVSRRLERDCSVGAVYTTLQRLEDKGFIASHMSDPTPVRGGRSRRNYAITPDGSRALRAARVARERLWKGVGAALRPA